MALKTVRRGAGRGALYEFILGGKRVNNFPDPVQAALG
jgi:hypothetical protein